VAERRIAVYFSRALGKLTKQEKADMEEELRTFALQDGYFGVMGIEYKEVTMDRIRQTEISGIPSHHCSEI